MDTMIRRSATRGAFLKGGSASGAAAALVAARTTTGLAAARGAVPAAGDSIQDILNTALIAEQLAMTFYYTGLTSKSITATPQIAGAGGDPLHVSPDGNPGNVAYLQAALDTERKHAAILRKSGASSPFRGFYFPAATFEGIGYTSHAGTWLWVLDHLETAFIGAYLAAIARFGVLKRPDLGVLAGQILGTECEHRALYRVISGDDPANNVTTEVASFKNVTDAVPVLKPFLTGQGFPAGATPKIIIPNDAAMVHIIGTHPSS